MTWKNLLVQSAPTFEPELTPPYGFVTSTLAAMRAEGRQQREFERIGVRALWAALAALGVAAAVTVTVNLRQDNTDFDPECAALSKSKIFPIRRD